MAEVTITMRDNGPYVIRGGATLTDIDGNTFETTEPIVLCRCGHSERKPFCDASHKRVGFQSEPRAGA